MRMFPALLLFSAVLLRAQESAVTFDQLNVAFGIPIWADDNLWDDDDAEVGKRLGWPEESRTPRDASFRRYAKEGTMVLGARPYSLALYGEGGRAERFSMVFINKGDAAGLSAISDLDAGDSRGQRAGREAVKDFQKTLAADKKTVIESLKAVLGEPKGDSFGQGRQSKESVLRWDWNGHAILVAAPRDEYLAVRIVSLDAADGKRTARKTDAELKAEIATRLERRENGDVIIKEIPMVNQGPKGFCVPATWERVMRYMGIPADMYVLAMAGGTGMGGGTSVTALSSAVKEVITRQGRRLESLTLNLNERNVAATINKGLPIMWTMYVSPSVNESATQRMTERRAVTDWEAWSKSLDPLRKGARSIVNDPKSGHVCMIIGYNLKTGEIAISDSWGKKFEERWITSEEAAAISQRSFMVVDF